MNKAEKQMLADQADEIKLLKAFTRTPRVLPDVIPYEGCDVLTGFVILKYSGTISPACSTFTSHGIGNNPTPDSKHAIPMYSTRLHALKALRNKLEDKFMEEAAQLDEKINALVNP